MNENKWDLTYKSHTKIKLKILKDYLTAWAMIFANREYCKELYYVDCFAGRGKYDNQGQKNIIDGSPLVALNIAKNIKTKYRQNMTCFFVEKDQKTFMELQNFIKPFSKEIKIHAEEGDTNKAIDGILAQIPDKRWAPVFFFIDPSGIDIKNESIEKMLGRSNIKEFLITYIQKGVERCLGFGSKAEMLPALEIHGRAISNLKRVEDFFGTNWKNLTKNEKENLKRYLNVFVKYNKNVDESDKLKFRIIDVLYNQGRNKYYLIFASRNKTALEIIEFIYTKTKTDGTLFDVLSPSEKKRMFRGKFEVR